LRQPPLAIRARRRFRGCLRQPPLAIRARRRSRGCLRQPPLAIRARRRPRSCLRRLVTGFFSRRHGEHRGHAPHSDALGLEIRERRLSSLLRVLRVSVRDFSHGGTENTEGKRCIPAHWVLEVRGRRLFSLLFSSLLFSSLLRVLRVSVRKKLRDAPRALTPGVSAARTPTPGGRRWRGARPARRGW
jgi:hypothetical protein